jgi:caspase domain-containing protein
MNLYALLIGIDAYLPNRMPNGCCYKRLTGCVRDVLQIEEFLRGQLEIDAEHILKITATKSEAGFPAEPHNLWPTYENIVAAFRQLSEIASPGDQIYIHYSGHGARVHTCYPELKGPDGFDEALVPVDIGYSESAYLRDVEVAHFLKNLIDRGLGVTAVLDACHSGWTNISLRTGWLPDVKGCVLLAACAPDEFAYECKFEEQGQSGALTHWLLDALYQRWPGMTYEDLFQRVLARVHGQFLLQTPMLLGEGDRQVFGFGRSTRRDAVGVLNVEPDCLRVLLNTGQVQGVRNGARFALYRSSADHAARQALVEVISHGSAESWAQVVEGPTSPIEPGAQAFLVDPGSAKLQSAVHLVHSTPLRKGKERFLGAIASLLTTQEGFLRLADPGKLPDFQVAVEEEGEVAILDSAGQPVPHLSPRLLDDAPEAVATTLARLVHLTKYRTVQELRNHDQKSPLAGKLAVDLLGVQADYDPWDLPEAQPGTEASSAIDLTIGQWTFLRIGNLSAQVLKFVMLDLQPDWGITQIHPGEGGGAFLALDPGRVFVLPIQGQLPEGITDGTHLLKVFATLRTTDFHWLELPALNQPQTRHQVARGTAASPTEELFPAPRSDAPEPRGLITSSFPSQEWTTAQVEVRVRRPSH